MNCSNLISPLVPLPAPSKLDKARMSRSATNLLQVLNDYLPEEFFSWTSEYRPDVARYIGEAEAELLAAVFTGEKKRFAEAVRNCSAMYVQAVDVFERDIKRARRMTYSGSLRVCAGADIN